MARARPMPLPAPVTRTRAPSSCMGDPDETGIDATEDVAVQAIDDAGGVDDRLFAGRITQTVDQITEKPDMLLVKAAMRAEIAETATAALPVSRHQRRSEERTVGKEGVSPCRSRWSPYPK